VLRFRQVPMNEDPARSLVEAFAEEIAGMYEGLEIDGPEMPKAGPVELSPPGGAFLVGFDDREEAVCCGGVKDLGDGICEIKKMYVIPEARRSGRASELLAALEDEARRLGHATVRLDTGPRQPHAERFYRNAGYQPIGNFNGNPVATFFGEKAL
jgi:GNAT superfamily N-acetyltransferase